MQDEPSEPTVSPTMDNTTFTHQSPEAPTCSRHGVVVRHVAGTGCNDGFLRTNGGDHIISDKAPLRIDPDMEHVLKSRCHQMSQDFTLVVPSTTIKNDYWLQQTWTLQPISQHHPFSYLRLLRTAFLASLREIPDGHGPFGSGYQCRCFHLHVSHQPIESAYGDHPDSNYL